MNIAIIGAGFAGLSAYLVLHKHHNILLFDKRTHFEYTPSLHLCLADPDYVKKIKFPLRKYSGFINKKVTSVKAKKILTSDNSYAYDYAILCTGATARHPPHLKQAHPFKSLDDVSRINKRLRHAKKVVVIGGGYTGVETAAVLAERGFHVSLVHTKKWLVNPAFSHKVLEHLPKINLYLGYHATGCGKEYVILNDGRRLRSDLTILAAGVVPNNPGLPKNMDRILSCGDASPKGNLMTAHNAMIQGRSTGRKLLDMADSEDELSRNWKILAIALGEQNGLFTSGNSAIRFPFTGLGKKIIEKKVLWEFKKKRMLWV